MKTTPRPKRNDDSTVKIAAQKLAPKVREWLEYDTDIEDIELDLAEAMKWHDDGYELARSLSGYTPDAALVSILDETAQLKYDALKAANIEWVKESGIAEIPLETKVRWLKKPEAGIGIITGNKADGRSVVTFDDIGQKNGTGYIVEWEQLEIEP